MALIQNAKGRHGDIKQSGYYRAFRHEEIARLLSKSQSTVITNGNELEADCYAVMCSDPNIITFTNGTQASNWVNTLSDTSIVYPQTVCLSKDIYKSTVVFNTLEANIEPDFIYYKNGCFYIEEKKDGDNFDTTKSKGEVKSLKDYLELFKVAIEKYTNRTYEYYPLVCMHNQTDTQKVVSGLKNKAPYFDKTKVTSEQVSCISGQDLCKELNIDFDNIEKTRSNDGMDNMTFFLMETINILHGMTDMKLPDNSIELLKEIIENQKQIPYQ